MPTPTRVLALLLVVFGASACSAFGSGSGGQQGNPDGGASACGIGSCAGGFHLDVDACRCVEDGAGGGGSSADGGGSGGMDIGSAGAGGAPACGLAGCQSGFSLDTASCECKPNEPPPPPPPGNALPKRGSWKAVSKTGAPSARTWHTIVWTGSEYAVWGGAATDGTGDLGDGALYDPAKDSWRPVTMAGAPDARSGHAAVWTGKYMAVFGREIDVFPTKPMEGALYDPAKDAWTPINATGAPVARGYYDVIAVNGKVVVWGGWDMAGVGTMEWPDATGGIYDPDLGTWTAIDATGAPKYDGGHSTLAIDGGFVTYGSLGTFISADAGHTAAARYDFASSSWTALDEETGQGGNPHQTAAIDAGALVVVAEPPDLKQCLLRRFDLATKNWSDSVVQDTSTSSQCPLALRQPPLFASGTFVVIDTMSLIDLGQPKLYALADVPFAEIADTDPAGFTIENWNGASAATDGASVFVFGGTLHGSGPMPNCPDNAPCVPPPEYDSTAYGALFTP